MAQAIKIEDLSGRRYGRWLVVSFAGHVGDFIAWNCLCDCGEKRIVPGYVMKRGSSSSCGCLRSELGHTKNLRHGMKRSPEWAAWAAMKNRCINPSNQAFSNYGGRGIKVCDRWLNSFENFLADMGRRPDGLTLERNDNNGDYEPGNCRWATYEQQANNRRSNRLLTARGETKTLAQWSKHLNIPKSSLHGSLNRGIGLEVIIQGRS